MKKRHLLHGETKIFLFEFSEFPWVGEEMEIAYYECACNICLLCMVGYEFHHCFIFKFTCVLDEIVFGLGQIQINNW